MSNYGGEKSPGFSFTVPQLSSNSWASDHNTDKLRQVPNNYPQIQKDRSGTASRNTHKRKADLENSVDQVPSIYSTGSSTENLCYSLEKRNEDDSEATSSPTTDNEEDELRVRKPAKRRRIHSEMHQLSERKRREYINKKMRALQALIPYSDKVDKASMLDNAIEYLKSLQLQLQLMMQLMTMGSRLCVPPTPMMLPTTSLGMQQIQAANMMGMRMPISSVGFCQFPNPGMLGLFAGRMPPPMLPPSQPPFIPLIGGSSALPLPCNYGSASISDLVSRNLS